MSAHGRWLPVRTTVSIAALASAACGGTSRDPAPPAETRWCDELPRSANRAFERVDAGSDWFEVYRIEDGVFALAEPRQFQETISYLIVGQDRALLFDTGLGLLPIRPVVERLTDLPITVVNSHTHYDHVGGNAEFDSVLASQTPYTRANQSGFDHEQLAGEVAATSFCGDPPATDTAAFHTRAWSASGPVADGDILDLGGRRLEVLEVPGHTPDALALLDREHGLLWTGDTYYDATIWLYVPETDLDAYERSMARLLTLAPSLRRLLPAHNTVAAEPAQLARASRAIHDVRDGRATATPLSERRVVFRFEGFAILTSTPLLEGRVGDRENGGSGLTTWP